MYMEFRPNTLDSEMESAASNYGVLNFRRVLTTVLHSRLYTTRGSLFLVFLTSKEILSILGLTWTWMQTPFGGTPPVPILERYSCNWGRRP